MSVCKFYVADQSCKFGLSCRFLHPVPVVKELDVELDDNNRSDKTLLGSKSTSPHLQDHSPATNSSSKNITKSNSANYKIKNKQQKQQLTNKPPICVYYARSKKCKYGKGCRFSHDVQVKPQSKSSYQLPNKSDTKSTQTKSNQHDRPKSLKETCESVDEIPTHLRTTLSNLSEVNEIDKQDHANTGNSEKLKSYSECQENNHFSKENRNRASDENRKQERICSFFKNNKCKRGERCRFRHPSDTYYKVINADNDASSIQKLEEPQHPVTLSSISQPVRRAVDTRVYKSIKPNVYVLSEISEDDIKKLRQSEINVIKKRFPKEQLTVLEESESNFLVHIKFSPSDPDWPFDVKLFEIKVTVPAQYPVEIFKIDLPKEQNLPETVRRYIEITVREWLAERQKIMLATQQVELIFRSFLKWFDKSLEDITTDALKQLKRELVARSSGIEIFSPQQLQEKLKIQEDELDDNQADRNSSCDSSNSDEEESGSESDGETIINYSNNDADKKGTEVELRHIQLKDNVSAIVLERLKVVIQCLRCKNHSDLLVHQSRVMSTRCGKCNQKQFVNYRPALVHQFSSIVGYIDCDGCYVFDLVLQDCKALVTCMGCSKQSKLEGLVSGQMISGWCQSCNAKFRLAVESVKLTQLMPSGVDTSVHKVIEVAPAKSKKPPKNPAIREGCPLPEFGTCRHYKHSYRWLRFPCCGKAYPCDVCHDKKEDHEMIFANRMICGHCCKEQHFSPSKPCTSCGQYMTKVRSSHWEGGKGCRDKISMSRNDNQKFKNQNKTVSNHKKATQSTGGKGKKNIKLRHS